MSTPTTTDSADFYALEGLLDDDEQEFLHRVRDFMKSEVEPTVNQHWQRGSFPFEIVPGFRQLGLAGLPYHGFGCPGRSFLLDGMVVGRRCAASGARSRAWRPGRVRARGRRRAEVRPR